MNTTKTESIQYQEKIAALPILEGRATAETAQTLRDEMLYHRATQTYLWALPLLNTLGMQRGSEKSIRRRIRRFAGLEETPRRPDAGDHAELGRDLRDELRRSRQGRAARVRCPTHVAGHPAGFLAAADPRRWRPVRRRLRILRPGPGQGRQVPAPAARATKATCPKGYFVCRSGTNNVFVFLRAFYADPNDLTPPVALIERTKIYPLKGEAKTMKFPDASGVSANMLPISDGSAFDHLKKLVDAEGPHLADPDWMGMLAGLGIVKGEPFQPDERTRGILDRAANSAYKMSRVVGFDEKVSGRAFTMYPDRRWVNPMADATPAKPSGNLDLSWGRSDRGGARDLDARLWMFTNYYSISPGMLSQIPGKGAFYVIAFTDSDGVPLTGGTNYKLNFPKDVPAANFWSVTLYEAENASGLANGQPFPSLGSRDKPVQNADGSTDLYLGPKAPEGQEKNWLATVPGRGYFAVLRLYGPTEPALTKTWKPGDVTKMK